MSEQQKPKGTPVKLTIISCVSGYSGNNARGDSYTIYEVEAAREDGERITDKKLRSFEDLPLGELLDLTVSPFNSEKYGVSYTLSQRNKRSSRNEVKDLAERVDDLTTRLQRLEQWAAGQRGAAAAAPAAAAVPVAQTEEQKADLDARYGAEAPF